jgi:hypothetical protein
MEADRSRRNPSVTAHRNLLLRSTPAFSVFNMYFAILANAVSTSERLTIQMTKKVTSKPATFVFATKSTAVPCVFIPRKRRHFASIDAIQCRRVALDELNDRLYARRGHAGSAAISVGSHSHGDVISD